MDGLDDAWGVVGVNRVASETLLGEAVIAIERNRVVNDWEELVSSSGETSGSSLEEEHGNLRLVIDWLTASGRGVHNSARR